MADFFPLKKTPPRLADVIFNPAFLISSSRNSCSPSAQDAWYSKTSGLKIVLLDELICASH
ncbi:MAG: hypothetical protein KA146_05875 [Leptospiraceae bacterium]|jgi:hypothetical protein|nr:hypothetical protein [Leptospiraceae bacterium]